MRNMMSSDRPMVMPEMHYVNYQPHNTNTGRFPVPKRIWVDSYQRPTSTYNHGQLVSDLTQDAPMDLSKRTIQTSTSAVPTCKTYVLHKSQLQCLLENGNSRKRKLSADEGDEPLNLSKKSAPASLDSIDMRQAIDNPVQLVKLSPSHAEVTSQRVSQLLIEMIHKVFSIETFRALSENDRVSLILNSWHRLLLWLFAKNQFSFQVSLVGSSDSHMEPANGKSQIATSHPSMAFVKILSSFIDKYQKLQIDEEEVDLLFAITLFHCGKDVCCNPEVVDSQRKKLMKKLQLKLSSKNGGMKRYADLLLYLPLLYGVNEKMFERLFFSHLLKSHDIRIFLKEVIKRVSRQ